MTRTLLTIGLAGTVWLASGCAAHSIMGHGMVRSAQLFGNVRLTGDNNNITALRGSRITKLSVMGDNNTVNVDAGATLAKVEFWGNGNTVSVPGYVVVRSNEVGTNQLVRRESRRIAEDTTTDWPATIETAPQTEPGLYYPPPETPTTIYETYEADPNATWEPNYPAPLEFDTTPESEPVYDSEPLPDPIIIGAPGGDASSEPEPLEAFEEESEPRFRPPPSMEFDSPPPLETGEDAAG